MSDTLLALLVTVPLVAAIFPLLVGLRVDDAGWPIAMAGSLAVVGLAGSLASTIYTAGPEGQRLIHELAGYPAPYGIELVGDGLSALIALLIGVVAVAVLVYDRSVDRPDAFYSGYLLLTGGLLGMTLTGDLFNLFVFLEIVGLVTYALVAAGDGGEAAYGALKYLFLGTVGASLYLIGVGYALVATGSLNMLDLQTRLAEVGYTDPLVQASFGFILVGFMLKIAVFPLHTWQPDAYTHAPDTVSAFISALVSTTAAYALIRIAFDVFTVDFFAANPLIADTVVLIASISIVVGSLLAATQTEVKRVFAYSSVAQFGMVVVAVGLNSRTALFGAVIHLIGHGLMKATLFMGAGTLSSAYGASTIADYAGLAKRAPYTGGAIAVTGLALVGIPPSIGLLGKWYIGLGAVESGTWSVAIVIFVSTLLSLSYVYQLIEALYFTPLEEPTGGESTADGAVDHATMADSAVADGGHAGRIAPERVAVVALLAVSTVVLFASVGLFDAMLDPVFGRFFQ
ncbi:proton-conducting transporter membrane subunit [Halohasta salina]|uniref:proton-conducting transporter transmembrane domain-containing protein n=1 Tax=Halohasta salina TaxID=2961621 RepID=UPI0020A5C044|nr:proton-conducting transporter membrane subunit [Halohasta salina]